MITSTTANSFAISRPATGPACISRPMKRLLSLAPMRRPSSVVKISKTWRITKTVSDGAGKGLGWAGAAIISVQDAPEGTVVDSLSLVIHGGLYTAQRD